jgi:hypothetical protein
VQCAGTITAGEVSASAATVWSMTGPAPTGPCRGGALDLAGHQQPVVEQEGRPPPGDAVQPEHVVPVPVAEHDRLEAVGRQVEAVEIADQPVRRGAGAEQMSADLQPFSLRRSRNSSPRPSATQTVAEEWSHATAH